MALLDLDPSGNEPWAVTVAKLEAGLGQIQQPPRNSKKILAVGDSFYADDTGYGFIVSAAGIEIRSSSPLGWLQFLSGGQFSYSYAAGMRSVGGHTTTELLNTDNGGLAAVLDATQPGILLWAGGINDATNNIPATTTIANDKAAIALAQARGVRVVLAGLTARNGWTDGLTSEYPKRRAWMAEVNRWREWAATTYDNVAYADNNPGWVDLTSNSWLPKIAGQSLASVRGDGLHPSDGVGGYYLGLALWNSLQGFGYRYRPRIQAQYFDGEYSALYAPHGNRLANATMQAMTAAAVAGLAGNYPTSWSVARSSGSVGTATGALVSKADSASGNAFQWSFALSGAGTNEQWRIDQTITGLSVGDKIRVRQGFRVVSSQGLRVPSMVVDARASGGGILYSSKHFNATGEMPGIGYEGYFTPEDITVPPDCVDIRMRTFITLDASNAANAAVVQLYDNYLGNSFEP